MHITLDTFAAVKYLLLCSSPVTFEQKLIQTYQSWYKSQSSCTLPFLARLFLQKTSRYCHSPGGGGIGIGGGMRNLLHFLISLLLPKIFT